jgi:LysM repeat protein
MRPTPRLLRRTGTSVALSVVLVGATACGTTDPAAQERLPPIRTTVATTTTTTTTVPPGDIVYVVQPGDTLFAIAERFGVTVDAIVQRNLLPSPDAIEAGQRLDIPEAKLVIDDSATVPPTSPAP